MKRIVSIKEYIIGLVILLILFAGLVYRLPLIESYLKRIDYRLSSYSLDILFYFITIVIYVLIFIESRIYIRRLKNKNLEEIKAYGIISKVFIGIFLISIHISFWIFIIKDIDLKIILILAGTQRLFKILIVDTIYISDDIFVVMNKIYDIKNLRSIKNNFGSNFNVQIGDCEYSIYCGSSRGKEKLMSKLRKKL